MTKRRGDEHYPGLERSGYPVRRASYRDWNRTITSSVRRCSPEFYALEAWIQSVTRKTAFRNVAEARTFALERLYRITKPAFSSPQERQLHIELAAMLLDIEPQLGLLLTRIERVNRSILAQHRNDPLSLGDLANSLHIALGEIGRTAIYLNRRRLRDSDALTCSFHLIGTLQDIGVDRDATLELARLVMKGHGFDEPELIVFEYEKSVSNTGKPRKRTNGFNRRKRRYESVLAAERTETAAYLRRQSERKNE